MSKPFSGFEEEWNGVTDEFAAFKSRVRALLSVIQWDSGDKCGRGPNDPCPCCHRKCREGHATDCEIKALLREAAQ
jgi:hypothetical protein